MRSPIRFATGRAAPLLMFVTLLLAACTTAVPTVTPLAPATATTQQAPATVTAPPTVAPTAAPTALVAPSVRATAPSLSPTVATRAVSPVPATRAASPARGSPAASPTPYRVSTATERFTRAGLPGQDLLIVATTPANAGLLYAGGAGLWRSVGGGDNWTVMRTPAQAPRVSALAIAPADINTVYVGVGEGCAKGDPLPGWVTTNGGTSWRETARGITGLAVDPKDAKHLYATTCAGVQESRDSGATWKPVAGAGVTGYDPVLIALAPSDPRRLYVVNVSEGGTVRIRRSSDGAATWRDANVATELSGPLALAVDAVKPDVVLLSTFGGLYITRDAGANWRQVTKGLEATLGAPGQVPLSYNTTVVADPGVGGRYWLGSDATLAGGSDLAVFMSTDGGASWRTVAPGLAATSVRGLAPIGTGPRQALFAATDDGLWATTVP